MLNRYLSISLPCAILDAPSLKEVKAAVEVAKDLQAKKLKVLVDVGSSFSHVSLHPFDFSFGFIFMPQLCFYTLLSIAVPRGQ
jgi:hypothetical protein